MSAQSSVQSLSSALRSSLHAQEYLPVNTPLAPTGAPLFTKQVKLQSSCSLPSGERSIPTSSSVLSEDSVDVKMPEYDRSSPDTSSLSSSATMRSCSPSSTSDLPCPPNLQTVPPVTAASVTATTIIWLSEDDMRCSLVRLSPQQDCCFGEAVGIGRGIFMLYTQQEGLVVVQDISAYVPPWCPSKGGPCLRPFCLFAPPRLDAKNGRKFLPATVYSTQLRDFGAHGLSESRENSTTPSTTHSPPSPSTPATSPDDKPMLSLPYPPTSLSNFPALPSSQFASTLSPSSSCQYSLLPSAEVSKLTVCAFYTEELAFLQLQRRHTQPGINGSGNSSKVVKSSLSGSSEKESLPTVKTEVGEAADAKETTALEKREDENSCLSPDVALQLDELGSKFFYPPERSFPASFSSVVASSFNHLLLDFTADTASGKNELLQMKPAGTTRVVDENVGLRSRLARFKRTYKKVFSDSVKDGKSDNVSRSPRRKRAGGAASVAPRRQSNSRAPAQTLNSKDGGASGRACARYQVDAEGRRILRSGYELSGDYMKHQQKGQIFELQGVFGANAKISQQPATATTIQNKEADKKTHSTSSTRGSSSLASSASVKNERAADPAGTSEGAGAGAVQLAGAPPLLSAAGEFPNGAPAKKQSATKSKGKISHSHGAFIPGDLFGKTAKKWAYVADDFDEDGIDEDLNMPSVVAEECKLLAGKRSSPLTGRCNVSLANLRSVSALKRTFSMSMYQPEGNRPIFITCIKPSDESDDESGMEEAVKGRQAGDDGDEDGVEEVTGEEAKVGHGSRFKEASRAAKGGEGDMTVDEQEGDRSVDPKANTDGADKELLGKENEKDQTVKNEQTGDGVDKKGEAGDMYRMPHGEMSYFGHVIEDGDILRVTYPSEYTGIYEEDIFRIWGEDTLRIALQKIVEMSSHGANTDFSAIHLSQYCQTLFWNLARLYEGDVDLGVRTLLPSLPERSRRQKRCIRDATEDEPKEKRQKPVDRKSYGERVQEQFEKLTHDCTEAAKLKERIRLSLDVDRSKEELVSHSRIRHKNLDDEPTLIRSIVDATGQIFTRILCGLTPLQKRVVYHHCLSINFTAPVALTVIEGKGRAVVAAGTIEKEDFVLEYKGETLSDRDARSQDLKYNRSFYHRNGSFMFYFKYDSRNFAIDSTNEFKPYGVARLINHSRVNPNLIPKPTSIDGRARLFFIAKRTIPAGTELLVDYGERDRQVIENNPWLMQ
eukprot:GHVS01097184.1.p1 GENE.GHVS01097184.1~~GHVS01097184.1.p1  ORF type:complete len:1229 (-),score=171.00 GHVS01097184.1:640-4326(-)